MITFDFETKSYADLKKVGAWAYSEDETTKIICCAYAIDQGEIQDWYPGKELKGSQAGYTTTEGDNASVVGIGNMPIDLFNALRDSHLIEAHNVAFERSIWMNIMVPRYGWMLPKDEQWRDTMAVAHYYALPGALSALAHAIGMGIKNPDGGRLITKYSKRYLKTARELPPGLVWVKWSKMSDKEKEDAGEKVDGIYRDDFKKFVQYCRDDVELERDVSNFLGDLPERELPIWFLDQKINLRGLKLDLEGIASASRVVNQRADGLTQEFRNLTGLNPTQRDKIMRWFEDQGVYLDNLQADYLKDEVLENEGTILLSKKARRVIEIRLAINKASTKKLDAMARQCSLDGRARYQTRYHGAGTGRWTGSGFQPLNLVRSYEDMDPDQLVRDIRHEDALWLDALYGDAMAAVAKASRYWIIAAPSNRIIAGDFVSIEAVILACLAGEDWKIKAFAEGVKIYEFMADKIYSLAPGTVSKSTHPQERFDGKTGELAFGYQGALGAWRKFDSSDRHSDERVLEICKAWRAEHPAIVDLWGMLQSAAIQAVVTGGIASYRQISFEVVDHWLTMILPNGKRLWYWEPTVTPQRPIWCNPITKEDCRKEICGHKEVLTLSYMSQKEGQWRRTNTFGGKLTENACQAVSREILVPAMLRAEEAGYPVILSVYDEIVTEVPKDHGSLNEFCELMAGPLPDWCADRPVRVDAWEGERYKK